MSISDDKVALRLTMKTHRAELSARNPDAGLQLAARFPEKLLSKFGEIVSVYWPIQTEIDTRPLIERLLEANSRIAFPRIRDDEHLEFHEWVPGMPLVTGKFGLQQPQSDSPTVTPTLILAPLLAFDVRGNRLGYGKGHYDRTVSGLRRNKRLFFCGLAFEGQGIEEVPADTNDVKLDWVVTEERSHPLFLANALGS